MTITVRLPDEMEATLKARLNNSRQRLSHFVREALPEKLERERPTKQSRYEAWRKHFPDNIESSGQSI